MQLKVETSNCILGSRFYKNASTQLDSARTPLPNLITTSEKSSSRSPSRLARSSTLPVHILGFLRLRLRPLRLSRIDPRGACGERDMPRCSLPIKARANPMCNRVCETRWETSPIFLVRMIQLWNASARLSEMRRGSVKFRCRRHRRVPARREEEENRASSPTPGSQRAAPQLGLATPPDSQLTTADRRSLGQRRRREHEAAARTSAASAGQAAPPAAAPSARSLAQRARQQRLREQAAAAAHLATPPATQAPGARQAVLPAQGQPLHGPREPRPADPQLPRARSPHIEEPAQRGGRRGRGRGPGGRGAQLRAIQPAERPLPKARRPYVETGEERHDLGRMDLECGHCSALHHHLS
ncbi:hypothetical protein C8R47DRAFT_518016 [Mycena vitilis]|nr:hypothetical protein C8R47DRAFT_518016 [Mycena vitilis]